MNPKITHLYFQQGASSVYLGSDDSPYHLFSLTLEGHWFPIISLVLLPIKKDIWETHVSELEKKHKRQGYGKFIYSAALNYADCSRITICSSLNPSNSANRVWESLSKTHHIRKEKGRFVYGKKI